MEHLLREFVQKKQSISEIEQRLNESRLKIKAIKDANPGEVSLSLITHLQKAKNDRDAIEGDLKNHIERLNQINNEIFQWLEEVPEIESVIMPKIENSISIKVKFDRKEKTISILSAG